MFKVKEIETGKIFSIYESHRVYYENRSSSYEMVELVDEEEVAEVVEDIKELSYSELKEVAKRLGLEFKGNISKKGLAKLIEE